MSETTQRWQVGDVTLTAIVEAETPGIPAALFFPDATADDVRSATWIDPGVAEPDGTITFRVQAFVIERDGSTVLVDPCVGNAKRRSLPFWNDLSLPWLERFRDAGFDPATVDMVVHTHLHEDHVGWDTHLSHGEWVPTFSNAIHVYVDEELEFAKRPDRRQSDDPYADSIAPILHSRLDRVVANGSPLGEGLSLMATPGHTPGHASLIVTTGAEPLVVSGDLLHHQFQLSAPRIAEIADYDIVQAIATRRAFLDEHSRSGAVVAGTHFAIAPVGRIEPDGPAAWKFASVPQLSGRTDTDG